MNRRGEEQSTSVFKKPVFLEMKKQASLNISGAGGMPPKLTFSTDQFQLLSKRKSLQTEIAHTNQGKNDIAVRIQDQYATQRSSYGAKTPAQILKSSLQNTPQKIHKKRQQFDLIRPMTAKSTSISLQKHAQNEKLNRVQNQGQPKKEKIQTSTKQIQKHSENSSKTRANEKNYELTKGKKSAYASISGLSKGTPQKRQKSNLNQDLSSKRKQVTNTSIITSMVLKKNASAFSSIQDSQNLLTKSSPKMSNKMQNQFSMHGKILTRQPNKNYQLTQRSSPVSKISQFSTPNTKNQQQNITQKVDQSKISSFVISRKSQPKVNQSQNLTKSTNSKLQIPQKAQNTETKSLQKGQKVCQNMRRSIEPTSENLGKIQSIKNYCSQTFKMNLENANIKLSVKRDSACLEDFDNFESFEEDKTPKTQKFQKLLNSNNNEGTSVVSELTNTNLENNRQTVQTRQFYNESEAITDRQFGPEMMDQISQPVQNIESIQRHSLDKQSDLVICYASTPVQKHEHLQRESLDSCAMQIYTGDSSNNHPSEFRVLSRDMNHNSHSRRQQRHQHFPSDGYKLHTIAAQTTKPSSSYKPCHTLVSLNQDPSFARLVSQSQNLNNRRLNVDQEIQKIRENSKSTSDVEMLQDKIMQIRQRHQRYRDRLQQHYQNVKGQIDEVIDFKIQIKENQQNEKVDKEREEDSILENPQKSSQKEAKEQQSPPVLDNSEKKDGESNSPTKAKTGDITGDRDSQTAFRVNSSAQKTTALDLNYQNSLKNTKKCFVEPPTIVEVSASKVSTQSRNAKINPENPHSKNKEMGSNQKTQEVQQLNDFLDTLDQIEKLEKKFTNTALDQSEQSSSQNLVKQKSVLINNWLEENNDIESLCQETEILHQKLMFFRDTINNSGNRVDQNKKVMISQISNISLPESASENSKPQNQSDLNKAVFEYQDQNKANQEQFSQSLKNSVAILLEKLEARKMQVLNSQASQKSILGNTDHSFSENSSNNLKRKVIKRHKIGKTQRPNEGLLDLYGHQLDVKHSLIFDQDSNLHISVLQNEGPANTRNFESEANVTMVTNDGVKNEIQQIRSLLGLMASDFSLTVRSPPGLNRLNSTRRALFQDNTSFDRKESMDLLVQHLPVLQPMRGTPEKNKSPQKLEAKQENNKEKSANEFDQKQCLIF